MLTGRESEYIYRKTTLSRIYTHFRSFLPSTYKIGMIHTSLYRYFWIYSDWTKFHLELVKLMDVFKNNGDPENFINNCFKALLNSKLRTQEKMITVPKKPLFLVFPYPGLLSLQTGTKFIKSLEFILNCCKLHIVLKSQNKLANAFRFKDRIRKEFIY